MTDLTEPSPAATRPSGVQRRAWIAEQLAPGAAENTVHVTVAFGAGLDPERLRRAWAATVGRHPALRLRFGPATDGLPEVTTGEAPWLRRPALGPVAPFDLGEHTVRAVLAPDGDGYRLRVEAHRSALDDTALEMLLDELGAAYAGGEPAAPGPVADRGWWSLPAAELTHRLDYWAGRLGGAAPPEIPRDRPAGSDAPLRRSTHPLAPELAGRLAEAGGGRALPALCAGLVAVLARWTGQRDVLIGAELPADTGGARWLGDLLDQAPLRLDVADDPAFADLLARVQATLVDAARNRAPLLEIVRRLGGRRAPGHRLISVTAEERRADAGRNWPVGVAARRAGDDLVPTGADLRVQLVGGPHPVLRADYPPGLFTAARIDRLLGHLATLLAAGLDRLATAMSALPMLDPDERERLLTGWQGPSVPYPVEPVHRQVQRRAEMHPDHPAIRLGDQGLTYRELDERATLLAHELRGRGLRPEEVVGVAMERSPEVFVAMLGVLKAGGAFVMMDPTHPPRRLAFLLQDTGARFVLTLDRHRSRLPEPDGWVPIRLDADWPVVARHAGAGPLVEWSHHDSLAYVLYTSGSTGQPKGVLIEHGPLSNFLLWMRWLFDLGPGDRMLQHMALIFDFAEGEFFAALSSGVSVVLVPEPLRTSPEAIGRLLTTERITYLGGPPAVLGRIPPGDYPDLRYLIAGGEAFPADLVNRWAAGRRRFINGYGPTEAAVGCIYYECEHRHWTGPPPIGRAMPNRYAYVVDAFGGLAPVGVPGEVVVGGAGLARGYLNRPELTAERFGPDPFRPGGRVYRTGDLGVWTEDGQIQFLGRIDSQVKLNGLRIELDEIESALTAHQAVVQAAVALRGDDAHGRRLVGYVVTRGDRPNADELRAHLALDLPPYMVPAQFVHLDGLPLSPVGKVDRAALPGPGDDRAAPAAFVTPRTAVERQVAQVFGAALGLGRVSVRDDFFELGGDSVGLLGALARIEGALGVRVPAAAAYAAPTVAGVAELIAGAAAGPRPAGADRAGLLLDEIDAMSDDEVLRLLEGGESR